jgi:acetyltransferase-like isoleucine patch superfamily enzyme
MAAEYTEVVVPREGVNDEVAHVVRWLIGDGGHVEAGQPIVFLETTKATFDLVAPITGFVFHMAGAGTEIAIGSTVALVSSTPNRPRPSEEQSREPGQTDNPGQVISRRARELIAQHSLPLSHFAGLSAVREADVAAVIQTLSPVTAMSDVRRFGEEELEPQAEWDAVLGSPEYRQVQELLGVLRRRMRAKFNRHVPTGTLLHDRWSLARDSGFGEGTNVYDECLILGSVKVGKHCWVGPFTILDGSHAQLTIGDYVDIGSGTHIYTHNTIERALTGHRAPVFGNSTTIGDCCFIAPHVIIGAGTMLGDHCFVAAGSYVEGKYAPYSYIAGNPARVVGTVDVQGDRARVRPFSKRE